MKYILIAAAFLISVTSFADDSLYKALGGKETITKIVNDTIDLSMKDPRTKQTFKNTKDVALVKSRIVNQICELSGGPCTYKGATMVKAHRELGINTKMFNALVEQLQASMRKHGISHRTQYKLLAILAPMHGDVIETKKKIAERDKEERERRRKMLEEED